MSQPAVIASAAPRKGVLSRSRGIVIAGRGTCVTLKGVSLALTGQGADLVLSGVPMLPTDLDHLFAQLRSRWGRIDFVVHCSGPADTGLPSRRYMDMDARSFGSAMDGCVHTFAAITRRATRIMVPGASLLSLNWAATGGAELPNCMFEVIRAAQVASVRCLAEELGPQGIRVNAIAAGPVLGAPARGDRPGAPMPDRRQHRAPLRRDVTPEEIGKAAVFLLSDLASGTTGETLHVDAGHHAIGLRGVPPP